MHNGVKAGGVTVYSEQRKSNSEPSFNSSVPGGKRSKKSIWSLKMWLLTGKVLSEHPLRACVRESHPSPHSYSTAKTGERKSEEPGKVEAESGTARMMSTSRGKWADRQKDQRVS